MKQLRKMTRIDMGIAKGITWFSYNHWACTRTLGEKFLIALSFAFEFLVYWVHFINREISGFFFIKIWLQIPKENPNPAQK